MNIRWLNPGRFLVLTFASLIIVGTLLLLLPVSANPGINIHPVDALFTSTSAVCVTGLIAIDTADYFSVFGRTVIAILIQVGGLGISSIGVFFIFLTGKKIGLKERILIKESLNLENVKGVVKLVKSIIVLTLCFEFVGTLLSFFAFSKYYTPLEALGIGAFHSIASFNNAGFDILGNYQSLIPYRDNVLLNLTTCGLIVFGGLGFYVIRDILQKRSLKKLSMNSKIVLSMTVILLIAGTLLLKLTDNITWLGAFFQSTSARTAGFSTYALGDFTAAGQFVLILLMFIGASPGSTGGGIKTTTVMVILLATLSYIRNSEDINIFHRRLEGNILKRAYCSATIYVMLSIVGIFLLITTQGLYY